MLIYRDLRKNDLTFSVIAKSSRRELFYRSSRAIPRKSLVFEINIFKSTLYF